MASLSAEQNEFLANPYVATVTTLRDDGSPHSTVVWVDGGGDELRFNTAVGRAKERHLKNDPRVSVTMIDPQNTYRWVSVTGRAELTTDGADAHIDSLAKKYLDKDEYPFRSPDEQRIMVKIAPDKIDSSGFDS